MNQTLPASQSQGFWSLLKLYFTPPVVNMLFLGFAAGLPILLIFSSLGLWLREAGLSRSVVTYFSWAGLGYSFKFVWAPLVDRLPVPYLSKLMGRRRSWLLLSQIAVISAIVLMACTNPQLGNNAVNVMAIAAVILGFSSATQDVVIDAYRIEVAEPKMQSLLSAAYVAGYRLAMIVAGAGVIFLAEDWGSSMESYRFEAWKYSYLFAAACMFVIGVQTTFFIREPVTQSASRNEYSTWDYLRFFVLFLICVSAFIFLYREVGEFIGEWFKSWLPEGSLKDAAQAQALSFIDRLQYNKALMGLAKSSIVLSASIFGAVVLAYLLIKSHFANNQMVKEAYWLPFKDFFVRYGLKLSIILLVFIGFYRISDIVLGVIANIFYQDMGFDKKTIAGVVKTFGVLMTILGGFLGGMMAIRFGVMPILLLGAILSSLTNILFMLFPNFLETSSLMTQNVTFDLILPSWGMFILVFGVLALLAIYSHSKQTQATDWRVKLLSAEVLVVIAILLANMLMHWLPALDVNFVQSSMLIDGKTASLGVLISADNLAAGLAQAAFIAFLSSLTNVSFTATQYAIFSSLMTLLPKAFGGFSGQIVDALGYEQFFLITTLIGLPVIVLVLLASKYLDIDSK